MDLRRYPLDEQNCTLEIESCELLGQGNKKEGGLLDPIKFHLVLSNWYRDIFSYTTLPTFQRVHSNTFLCIGGLRFISMQLSFWTIKESPLILAGLFINSCLLLRIKFLLRPSNTQAALIREQKYFNVKKLCEIVFGSMSVHLKDCKLLSFRKTLW